MGTILIVDDIPIFRDAIEMVLRTEGFATITASNGQEALAALSATKIDLVLLDLGMPVMDGLSVLRNIRKNDVLKETPVIILSAVDDQAQVKQAVKLGISGYLLKTHFSLKEMLARVKSQFDAAPAVPTRPAGHTDGSIPSEQPTIATEQAHAESAAEHGSTAKIAATPKLVEVASDVRSVSGTSQSFEASRDTAASLSSLKPIIARSDLLTQLRACEELKGFSPTVSQVLRLTESENSSLDAVSKAIGQDQAMALKILKIANSSVYSRSDRVDTVHKAVLRIGMASIRETVLNIGVVERFSSVAFKEHLNTQQFWEHSIGCGIIAAEIAHAMKSTEAASAFTSGLLHDLGRVIFAEAIGEQYTHVIETARRLQAPLEIVETKMLLLNHADAMAHLLSAWKFPKPLVEPIVYHHLSAGNARSIAPTRVAEILRLGLANRLAHAMLLGSSGNETIYPTEEHCRGLGIASASILSIEETARQQTDDTKFALLSSTNSSAWPRRCEQVRASMKVPFRPLYVSAAPEIDAYRIFCTALAGPPTEEAPTILVAHVTSVRELAPLAEGILSAEQSAGAARLPLLVLSPTGRLAFPQAFTHDRAHRLLATPVAVSRFVETVRELSQASPARSAA